MAATIIRAHNQVAPAGTPAGNQKRSEFIAKLLDICGDVQLLWLPALGETTISTDRSRYARVLTYDATVASRYSTLGSGVAVDFDGIDDEADTPDIDGLSFGDGAFDSPLSIVVLCKPDVNNVAMKLLAKEGSAAAEEWSLGLNASGHLVMTLTDESASATLLGTFATAVGTAWVLLVSSYDGQGAATGFKNFKNGLGVTTVAGGAGTYVAMENTAALVHLGARYAIKEQFLNSGLALALLVGAALDPEQNWALAKAVDAYFDLALT